MSPSEIAQVQRIDTTCAGEVPTFYLIDHLLIAVGMLALLLAAVP